MKKIESRDKSPEIRAPQISRLTTLPDAGHRKLQATNYKLTIVHLYPKEMNIYGDTGNRLVLQKRAEWRGIDVQVKLVGVGDPIPGEADIIIGGGGQDAGQGKIQDDLQAKAADLHKLADNCVVMLMICGMYQLFGRKFTTHTGEVIGGIGVLPLETVGGDKRLIGNTVYDTPYGEIVGYENHSGVTALDDPSTAFATVVQGDGNNGRDKTEGCRVQNVFGTYSHGPVLVKNPQFADELLRLALLRRYGEAELPPLDDSLELAAHAAALSRPR
jgi:CobQ-like glutamine amidotransferase family enzyme